MVEGSPRRTAAAPWPRTLMMTGRWWGGGSSGGSGRPTPAPASSARSLTAACPLPGAWNIQQAERRVFMCRCGCHWCLLPACLFLSVQCQCNTCEPGVPLQPFKIKARIKPDKLDRSLYLFLLLTVVLFYWKLLFGHFKSKFDKSETVE